MVENVKFKEIKIDILTKSCTDDFLTLNLSKLSFLYFIITVSFHKKTVTNQRLGRQKIRAEKTKTVYFLNTLNEHTGCSV